MKINLSQQIRQNFLAIFSIAIAISALSYNSWRNERSEANRNIRAAGFEIMKDAAQLQYIVDSTTFSNNPQKTDPIDGWVKVGLIVSLSELMMPEVERKSLQLKAVWAENWASLEVDKQANEKISQANAELLSEVRKNLLMLN